MRNWLSGYLSVLVMIPVVLLILVGVFDTYRSFNDLDESTYTLKVANLVKKTSAAVHEMQKERGMSAGYLSSNGASFSVELPRQRQLLDQKLTELKDYVESTEFDATTSQSLATIMRRLEQLNTIRQGVTAQSIAVADMLAYYTPNNRIMIELSTVIAHNITDDIAIQQFETLFNVANIKENAGIERAVLSSAFASNDFTPELYKRFITLLVKQETYLNSAELMADKEYVDVLRAFQQSPEEKAVQQYRQAAEDPSQLTQTTPEQWFSAATKRINLLKKDEEILLSQITANADGNYSSATTFIVVEAILLLITLYLAYVINRTLAVRAQQTSAINEIMRGIVNDKNLADETRLVSRGELGNIAIDLNTTMKTLGDDFSSFSTTAKEVVEASQNTSVVVEQSTANLTTMRNNIHELVGIFNELNNHIISDISDISDAESMAGSVASGAKEGAQSVSSAVSEIKDMAQEVVSVGDVISQLNERVNDILGMVDVIRAVADQTNLLALNAAIEAARAGEQGRGFAVVADEVRSLAQRTQESTEEISRVVDELMNSSKNASRAIELGSEKATTAVDAVNSIDSVLSEVVNKITALDELTKSISGSAKDQMSQVTEISAKVLQIDNLADDNLKGSTDIAQSTIQLFNQSSEMLNKIKIYKLDNNN